MSIFVDVNVIQNLPPCCVNRDDTGAPKSAVYGGVQRMRISSQAWKHAMREEFKNILSSEEIGKRTKRIVGMVAEKIMDLDSSLSQEKAEKMAMDALTLAGIKIKSVKEGSDALTFVSDGQASALAALAVEGNKDKKAYKAAFNSMPSVDMALFGRMVASDPSLNYDASCQVAHAITTHRSDVEFDYFTAVDDLQDEDNAGAGHLGVNEFSSGTVYRYATVNATELFKSLGVKTPETIAKMIQAFVTSMPSGKQNSYANRTVPALVYVTIRTDQPVNLAGAFENPVLASNKGFTAPSINELVRYANNVYDNFADQPEAAYYVASEQLNLGKKVTLKDLYADVEAEVNKLLQVRAG